MTHAKLWILLAVLMILPIDSASAQRLIGGFGAESNKEQLASFAASGVNAQLWVIRAAPQMKLRVDERGRVVMAQMNAHKRENYANYARMAGRHGVDLYVVAAFFQEYVKQLQQLGPYARAVIQGPTRYHPPGEKPAPAPLEERYWLGQLLCEARLVAELSKEHPSIKGFLVDTEMYAGQIMWRWHCSFDDQTLAAVAAVMKRRGRLKAGLDPMQAPRAERYEWLKDNGLLDDYFDIQEELVAGLGRRFRQEIDKINPKLVLGFLPYEANWHSHGWARGLSSPGRPVLICSEAEYSPGFTPRTLSRIANLRARKIPCRYWPGLMIGAFSPKQLAYQARRCLQAADGYWMFTTYSLWQPRPERLRGAYLIKASRDQYWAALKRANEPGVLMPPEQPAWRFESPGNALLTANGFYPGPKVKLPVKVTYSVPPDVPRFGDSAGAKLFDGGHGDAYATVAWYAKKHKQITVVIDLSRQVLAERVLVQVGHTLENWRGPGDGRAALWGSTDGKMYYPISKASTPMSKIDADKLGIRVRFLKLILEARGAPRYGVWALSELAVWGSLLP